MTNPRIAIDITANDKSGKGVGSAEKRLGHLGGTATKLDRGMRAIGSGSGGLVGTFAKVEGAANKAFGGTSVIGTLGARLSGVRAIGSALSSSMGSATAGMGEAAEAGGVLEGVLGGVGAVAAGTAGILVAAAAASFKLADGWAKGAASIGRTADIIGVASDKLQQFQGAAARVGVDEQTAGGAIGGLSQTLNDARYGRNAGALAVLARMGVQLKTNADGTVDVGAMLPQIADAITRQNSSGRRTAARALGISEGALPAFTQGGKALSSDMADYGRRGAMQSGGDIELGKRLQRRDVIAGQVIGKHWNDIQRANAGFNESATDAVVSGTRTFVSAVRDRFSPGADKIDRAGSRMEAAVNAMGGGAGRLTGRDVAAKARQGSRLIPKLMALGLSSEDATALAANAAMESGADAHKREVGGHGFGLFQITDRRRRALFRQVTGVDPEQSSEDQQLRYQVWELTHSEAKNWRRAHENGSDVGNVSAGYARYIERPANATRDSAERAAVAQAMVPVHVTVELVNASPGTKARVTSGPAISQAMQH